LFRKSKKNQQPNFFEAQQLMSAKMSRQLQKSWAQTFREAVLERIPEEIFAVLFSEIDSRPNAPINILVSGDMLKSGFGWTDDELEEHMNFDLLTRHALGLDELSQEAPTLRTVYNLRRRVREYAEKTGTNLYEQVFAHFTDTQITRLKLKTGWQRMDSTQLLSNIARLNRLELVIAVLQKGVSGLPKSQQQAWQEAEEQYLCKPPQNVCYRIRAADTEGHLLRVGELLLALWEELRECNGDEHAIALVERILAEQYEIKDNQVTLKAEEEIATSSMQSPHDPEATYREKNGESYQGYVINLSETCDSDNRVQLITSVQTASNNTDDGQLLADTLDDLDERGIAIEQATVDGGYNGDTTEEACDKHSVTLRPTTLRGRPSAPDQFGWEAYTWVWDKATQSGTVTCPGGQTKSLQRGSKENRLLARFDRQICANCPFYKQKCRVEELKKKPPTLYVKQRSIQVALLRQGMSAENYAIRANTESTVHAFKHPFSGGKLPVRGLIRSHMVACGSALMVNLHRLHHYLSQKEEKSIEDSCVSLQIYIFWRSVTTFLSRFLRCRAIIGCDYSAVISI
jgi:hypothetical protein